MKKILVKIISSIMAITMIFSFSTTSVFAESKLEKTPQVSTQSNDINGDLSDALARALLYCYLYVSNTTLANSFKEYELTYFSGATYGDDLIQMFVTFSYKNWLLKEDVTIELYVGNKSFWNSVVNDARYKTTIAADIAMIILDLIAVGISPDGVQYATNHITNVVGNASSLNSLKKLATAMSSSDMLVYIPTVIYYDTFLGANKEPRLTTPGYSGIAKEGIGDVPDDIEAPEWVYSGENPHFNEY